MSAFILGNILFATYWFIWAVLAIKPVDRRTFWFESIVPFIAFILLYWAHWNGLFSKLSLVFLFIFSVIHTLAAHYTYSATSMGNWFKRKFHLRRNYFDRFVHFAYGVLAVPLFSDLIQYHLPDKFLRGIFVFAVIVAIGSIYEILEYFVVAVFGPKEGSEFLGHQGDIWDAQKDMLSQLIGAFIGVFLLLP